MSCKQEHSQSADLHQDPAAPVLHINAEIKIRKNSFIQIMITWNILSSVLHSDIFKKLNIKVTIVNRVLRGANLRESPSVTSCKLENMGSQNSMGFPGNILQ